MHDSSQTAAFSCRDHKFRLKDYPAGVVWGEDLSTQGIRSLVLYFIVNSLHLSLLYTYGRRMPFHFCSPFLTDHDHLSMLQVDNVVSFLPGESLLYYYFQVNYSWAFMSSFMKLAIICSHEACYYLPS